ncbi:hypothetical protein EX30DRAFT_366643 [Ascodesmis nigricans]|uniref:F-box domain-containing protein n=1 Tax=Ascodesmis nigricans TaxID=341454 RepID=A0A4S2MRC4_9PEZI|nr:hypothetical protein EX30DRAFT_366643 [Ascodesmis nigricans]
MSHSTSPPLLALPTETLIHILHYIACPETLTSLRLVSRDFNQLIFSPSTAVDTQIWKPCAKTLLRDLCPETLHHDCCWLSFVWRIATLSKPSASMIQAGLSTRPSFHPTTGIAMYNPSLVNTTDSGPQATYFDNDEPENMVLCPAGWGYPTDGKLVFLHTSTEESRTDDRTAFSAATRDFGVFTDPTEFVTNFYTRANHLRFHFSRKHDPEDLKLVDWVPEGAHMLAEMGKDIKRGEDWPLEDEIESWVKMSVHSDSDLVLIPSSPPPEPRPHNWQHTWRPTIHRVRRLGEEPMEWDLSSITKWSQLSLKTHSPQFPPTWEFRSAGKYLIVCDDTSSTCASTLTCFTPSSSTPLWQKQMLTSSKTHFLDNDGVKITPTYIAYASRFYLKHSTPGPFPPHLPIAAASFTILSPATGDVLRTLTFEPESRIVDLQDCFWTSFDISDSLLAATISGHGPTGKQYRWRQLLVWDLSSAGEGVTVPATLNFNLSPKQQPLQHMAVGGIQPSWTLPIPLRWRSKNTYVKISENGRWLMVTCAWEAVVWDLLEKRWEGAWEFEGVQSFEDWNNRAPGPQYKERGWNGLWIAALVPNASSAPAPAPAPATSTISPVKEPANKKKKKNKQPKKKPKKKKSAQPPIHAHAYDTNTTLQLFHLPTQLIRLQLRYDVRSQYPPTGMPAGYTIPSPSPGPEVEVDDGDDGQMEVDVEADVGDEDAWVDTDDADYASEESGESEDSEESVWEVDWVSGESGEESGEE